jgi:rare lipoprotein A
MQFAVGVAVNRMARKWQTKTYMKSEEGQRVSNMKIAAVAAALISAYLPIGPQAFAQQSSMVIEEIVGQASWYGAQFQGRRTASGEVFDMSELTAAHQTLPFGTQVRVTNPRNGRSVIVRINDRGPYSGQRIIDLSRMAAELLGLRAKGVGRVRIEVLAST